MKNRFQTGGRMTNDDAVDAAREVLFEPISIMETQLEYDEAFGDTDTISSTSSFRLYASFWTLGLLNNSSYVIMLAAAKSISEGGTALVFLANILPALVVKGTAPYWFDYVSYQRRLQWATLSMMTCFGLVASSKSLPWQLVGVAFASLQTSLGEASSLALAGKVDGLSGSNGKGQCLTSFSSGTGFAGVFGFFWKWFWNDWLQFTLSTTMWLAMGLAVGYWATFQFVRRQKAVLEQKLQQKSNTEPSLLTDQYASGYHDEMPIDDSCHTSVLSEQHEDSALEGEVDTHGFSHQSVSSNDLGVEVSNMTGWQRFGLVLSLWPYTIPLFTVYVAEYSLQSGTWTTIGFPVSDVESRNAFFQYSNWMYQAGVFLSRSSGTLFVAPMALLWLMPFLQVLNVVFYWVIAASQQDHEEHVGVYSPVFLYAVAFYTGLLGGAVYSHGYLRICKDMPLKYHEFALSSTSVAETLGIVVADCFGLLIQACLYHINGIEGAIAACPIK
jgi:battenin